MVSYGYCQQCKKNVNTNRGKFSYLLAFLLGFTGIGLIVYILYYIDRKPNRCPDCSSICEILKSEDQIEQFVEQKIETSYQIYEQKHEVGLKFCPNCGVEVGERSIRYCALCGSSVE